MEPKGIFIEDLAKWDPITAYGIAIQVPRIPICMNAKAVFASRGFFINPNQVPIRVPFDTVVAQRTWLSRVDYAVHLTNSLADNTVFISLYQTMLKQQPNVGVRLSALGGPQYLVSDLFTPLENLGNLFGQMWPMGWPLIKPQQLIAEFVIDQQIALLSSEGATYTVTLTFTGWQFIDQTLENLTAEEARDRLRYMGFGVAAA